ncbi:MAG TPA: hypothetical protein VMF06_01300 [Candidatus Limnocylindria bacterium]|nr:hypothetical protein [Candidatus Limnocylindria bacterium]
MPRVPPLAFSEIHRYHPAPLNDTSQETDNAIKRFGTLFVCVLFAYVTLYSGCEMWRLRGGAYTLVFYQNDQGVPTVSVKHRKLLPNGPITLTFPGESPGIVSNRPIEISYGKPWTNDTPFGPVAFVNTTDLPGTVAVNIFGHAVELLPRRILLDFNEIPWVSGTNIMVGTNKPPAERLHPKNQEWQGR